MSGDHTSGRLITFEGGEGAGKSTQVKLLADALEKEGIDVLCTREPGGSPGAEQIRDLILTGETGRWSPMTETLLVNAARQDHLETVILPALSAGKWVICDRYADSTLAYQGLAGEAPLEVVTFLNAHIAGVHEPDLTIYMDVSPEVGIERIKQRDGDNLARFERMPIEFHHKLRAGFQQIASDNRKRVCTIDARQDIDTIAAEIWLLVYDRLDISPF